MTHFDTAVSLVLHNEGGLIDNSYDKGGITNYGISLRFLKNIPTDRLKMYQIYDEVTEDTIKELNINQAKKIYYNEFWIHAPFDKINNPDVVSYIFDAAINMGISPAIKCLQRAVWSVMKDRCIVDDGILGDETLAIVNRCDFLLLVALRSERAGYYRLVAQMDIEHSHNLNGWLNRAYKGTV